MLCESRSNSNEDKVVQYSFKFEDKMLISSNMKIKPACVGVVLIALTSKI